MERDGKDLFWQMSRVAGITIIVGGLLAAVSTAVHPLALDPHDVVGFLREVAHESWWQLIHWAAALGFSAWLAGIVMATATIERPESRPLFAVTRMLLTASVASWLLVFTLETAYLGVWVSTYRAQAGELNATQLTTVHGLLAFSLAFGYVAAGLQWLAVTVLGAGLRVAPGQVESEARVRPGTYPLILGLVALAGMPVAYMYPGAAAWVVLVTSVPAFAWTLWFGYTLCRV